jgi:hypothetical protein
MRRIGLGIAGLLLAACAHKDIDNKDAVQQAVVEYLTARQATTGLNMGTMDVSVLEMRFEKDSAHVTMAFRIKGSDAGMNMPYTLDRKGDKWVVRPPADSSNPHGDMPATVVPGSGVMPPGATLPPGHPAVGSKAPAGSKE